MKKKNSDSRPKSRMDRLEISVNEIRELAKENQSTLQDLMEVMNNFATQVQTEFVSVRADVAELRRDVVKMRATMVTKDYLDDKLGDLRGDLVLLMHKEDSKLRALLVK